MPFELDLFSNGDKDPNVKYSCNHERSNILDALTCIHWYIAINKPL